MVQSLLDNAAQLLIWGLAATLVMTTMLNGSHGLG